ncbi:tyrosine-type recombinase/integrase [Salinibacter sp.]|uniref:tyrosine-type recombinase/integrase n=1 Tax=Salinibacter sp. TaxID=2065818 RepID=UPI0021E960B5|nr:site-specific integrase [Salinibacter sp.]
MSVRPVLRSSKEREDGRAPVWVRITINRKSRYISTGIYIKPKHWNDRKRKVRKSHELAPAYNDKIRTLRLECEEAALKADTAQAVKDEVQGESGSLSKFFERFIQRLDDRDQYWERKKYTTTLNKLHEALGEELQWDDLTSDALSKLERYCRKERENNPNTTRKELSRVRRVVNQAVKEKVISAGDDPFLTYEMPERVEPDRRSLSPDEIRSLKELDLDPNSDLARDRDAFLLAIYGGGVRFSDVCCLRPSNIRDGRLKYRMLKTDKLIRISLPDSALEILERWRDAHDGPFLFPYLEKGDDEDPVHLRKRISVWNQMANRSLKKLARKAEIQDPDDVTMHVARHSFSDLARRRGDDLYAVSKALGHSDLKTTERYLAAFDDEAVEDLADKIWDDD